MKKRLSVCLLISLFLLICNMAFAEDWRADFENKIIETGDFKQAVEDAKKAGISKDEIFLATVDIFKFNKISETTICDVCDFLNCCTDPSPSGICSGQLKKWCEEEGCCD